MVDNRLAADRAPAHIDVVPRGLPKGTGQRFHQRTRSPGAQPEIASKAVGEEIADRLHGEVAELLSSGSARW